MLDKNEVHCLETNWKCGLLIAATVERTCGTERPYLGAKLPLSRQLSNEKFLSPLVIFPQYSSLLISFQSKNITSIKCMVTCKDRHKLNCKFLKFGILIFFTNLSVCVETYTLQVLNILTFYTLFILFWRACFFIFNTQCIERIEYLPLLKKYLLLKYVFFVHFLWFLWLVVISYSSTRKCTKLSVFRFMRYVYKGFKIHFISASFECILK